MRAQQLSISDLEFKSISQKMTFKSKTILTLLGLLLCSTLTQGQQLLQTQKPFTVFDGSSPEKYVTYLRLDGSQGVSLPILSQPMERQLEYTIMLWFKAAEDSWGTRYQYAFEISNALSCYFTASNTLMCESSQKCEKLQVDVSNALPNRWTHLTLVGNPSGNIGSSLMLETNLDLLQQDKKSYLILQQQDSTWKACLGGCDNLYGFIGGLRDFIILSKYVTPDTARRLKNHQLNWDPSVIAYYRFTEKDFLKDQFRANFAQVSYKNTSSRAIMSRDFIPNDICHPFNETILLHKFSQRGNDVAPINIDGRWTPKDLGWAYSVSLWVMTQGSTCTASNPNDAKSSCFLVHLQDAFMLFFSEQNKANVYFFNQKPYYETYSGPVFVPHGQWINIQMGVSQYSGYEVVSIDILGRVIQYTSEKKDMQSQDVNSKVLNLFRNFQGYSRQLVVLSRRLAMPMTFPNAQFPNPTYWMDDSCLAYYRFDYSSIQGSTAINFCKNTQHAQLTAPVTLQGAQYAEFPVSSGATFGLTTSNQKLFDGIACADGNMVNQFTSKNSVIKTQTHKFLPVNGTQQNATAEFWFKMTQPIVQTNYLFTLWGQNSSKEFMSIFYDSTGILICAPFGWDSVQSPFVNFQAYTQANITKYGWMHLTCQFDQNTEKIAIGHLHRYDMEESYALNLTRVQYLPNDLYEIYLGNNRNGSKGTMGLQMREFRLWGYKRAFEDIQHWRYRTLDVRTFTPIQMLAYLKLDEGSFDYFNFATVINPNISSTSIIFKDIKQLKDAELLVCPINTFYSSDKSKCYQDPVEMMVGAIYPTSDGENGTLMWNFDSTATQLINPIFAPQIRQRWQFDDPLLKSLSKFSMNHSIMKVPARAFRDESTYKLKLNFTNTDITFNQVQEYNFVPISCYFFGFNGTESAYMYQNYTSSQSTEDITFTMKLIKTQPWCDDATFYDQLIPTVSYRFSPQLENPLQLDIKFNSDLQTFTVTIPQREQFKVPIKVEFKIIFDFKFTSAEYGSQLNTSALTFSNSLYSIIFNSFGMTVIPSLSVSRPVILKGEEVTFDAAQTYVLYAAEGERQKNLTFSWLCPPGFEVLCLQNKGQNLTITSSNFSALNGAYNQSLTFTVIISWTRPGDNNTMLTNTFTAQQSAIWQNVLTPAFTMFPPAVVRATADNQKFSIFLNNYDTVNLTLLSITWSLLPNLTTTQTLNLTQNNTVLTVPKGAFAALTTYTLTVIVTNRQFPAFASRSQSITFTTQRPPFGGSVAISPLIGNARDTNFTITLSNWQSTNRPIRYRVWSTANPLGTTLQVLLTQDWLLDSQFFTFRSLNTNPFQVEITDLSGEVIMVKTLATITDRAPVSFQSLIKDISGTTNNEALMERYHQMQQLVDLMNTNSSNSTETKPGQQIEVINSQQQVTSRGLVVQQITKDIQSLSDPKSIETGDSQLIIMQSVTMLSQISTETQFMDDYIAQSSLAILKSITGVTQVTERLLQSDQTFQQQLANALSNLMKYSSARQQEVNRNGRRLYNTTTLEGLSKYNSQLRDMKNDLADRICSSISPDSVQQDIRTESFQLLVEKFSVARGPNVELRSFAYSDDSQTRVVLSISSLLQQAQKLNENLESLCAQVTYFKVNLNQDPASKLSQYSSSVVDVQLADLPQLNPRQYMRMVHKIDAQTFRNNQTLCTGFQNFTQTWTNNVCQSIIMVESMTLECTCNMMDTLYQGLFTDPSRLLNSPLIQPKEYVTPSASDSSIQASTVKGLPHTFIGLFITLLLFAIVLPIISLILDRRDFKQAQKQNLKPHQAQTIQYISKIANEPIGYWFYKLDDVLNYQIKSKSFVSHAFTQTHPLISIFTHYDPASSRLSRFIQVFFQVALFALACVLIFAPEYRPKENRNENVIDQQDIDMIITIGVMGMIGLLPIPYLQGFLRSKLEVEKKVRISVTQRSLPNHHTETIEQHNPTHNSPNPLHQRMASSNPMNAITAEQLNNENQQQDEPIQSDYKLSMKYKCFHALLALISYCVCFVTLILSLVFAAIGPVANQYCMISSFFIGLFGSFFITHTLRVLFNSFLVEKALSNKKSCLLNFLVSNQAIRIAQELAYVRQADFDLSTNPKEIDQLKSERALFNANSSQQNINAHHMTSESHRSGVGCDILNNQQNIINYTNGIIANSQDILNNTNTIPNQKTETDDLCIFTGQLAQKINEDQLSNYSQSPMRKNMKMLQTAELHQKNNPLRVSQNGIDTLRKSGSHIVTEPHHVNNSSVIRQLYGNGIMVNEPSEVILNCEDDFSKIEE